MKIKATRTAVEHINVDVSLSDLQEAVLTRFHQKYPNIKDGSYIDHDGYWQHFDYVNGHNGDDEYVRGEKVTEEEIRLVAFRDAISDLFV